MTDSDVMYQKEWNELQRFLGEENDGLQLLRFTSKETEVLDVSLGLFIWLANNIQKLICPECKQLKPEEDFVRDGKNCRDCSF